MLNDIAHAKDDMLVSAALSVDLSKLLDTVDGVQEISAIWICPANDQSNIPKS